MFSVGSAVSNPTSSPGTTVKPISNPIKTTGLVEAEVAGHGRPGDNRQEEGGSNIMQTTPGLQGKGVLEPRTTEIRPTSVGSALITENRAVNGSSNRGQAIAFKLSRMQEAGMMATRSNRRRQGQKELFLAHASPRHPELVFAAGHQCVCVGRGSACGGV